MEGGSSLQSELEILKSRLNQSLERAGLWMNEEATQLDVREEKRHDKYIKELQEEKQKIQNRIASQQKEYAETNQMLSAKCGQLEALKTELEKLYSLTQELSSAKASSEQQMEEVKQSLEKIQHDIEVPTKNRQKLEYLSKSSEVFGNMLGMTFRKTSGKRLQVTFTHIDEKDPLMPFYFFLQIQEPSKKYVVSDAEPPIEGLEELVKQLNTSNNIRQFIIAMRRKFQALVRKH